MRCKKCGEYVSKSVSFEHLKKWRDLKNLKSWILDDELDNVELSLKHDVDVNGQFEDLYNYSKLQQPFQDRFLIRFSHPSYVC